MPLRRGRKRGAARRAHDRAVATWVRETLARGEVLRPADYPAGS
jgi:hypothetical protein